MEDTFTRKIAGRDIVLRIPTAGQRTALVRLQQATLAKMDNARKTIEDSSELYRTLSEMSERFDVLILDFIESLIVSPEDVDYLTSQQLMGKTSPAEMTTAIFFEVAPDDDETPVAVKKAPAARKSQGRKAPTPRKATANAKRVQK